MVMPFKQQQQLVALVDFVLDKPTTFLPNSQQKDYACSTYTSASLAIAPFASDLKRSTCIGASLADTDR